MTAICPECAGRQIPEHPKGLLVFDHDRAGCAIGRAEDSTTDTDLRRAAGWLGPSPRPTPDTEGVLLAAVGIAPAQLKPQTNVPPISRGILRRHWTVARRAAA